MNANINIVSVIKKVSKEGKNYEIVYALIKIGDQEFMRKFYVWH